MPQLRRTSLLQIVKVSVIEGNFLRGVKNFLVRVTFSRLFIKLKYYNPWSSVRGWKESSDILDGFSLHIRYNVLLSAVSNGFRILNRRGTKLGVREKTMGREGVRAWITSQKWQFYTWNGAFCHVVLMPTFNNFLCGWKGGVYPISWVHR